MDFLQKINSAITRFYRPVPLPNRPVLSKPLPKALLSSKFVFIREDASSLPLSQLYWGPYKVIDRKDKYFKIQIGSKLDNVSVDRFKPVFSGEKVSPALPPPLGRPFRRPPPTVSKPTPTVSNLRLQWQKLTNLFVSPIRLDGIRPMLPYYVCLRSSSDAPSGGEICSGQDIYC